MSERWTREIPSENHSGRARALVVFLTDRNRVAVHAPGETAIIHPSQVQALKQALTEAQVEAMNRGGDWE